MCAFSFFIHFKTKHVSSKCSVHMHVTLGLKSVIYTCLRFQLIDFQAQVQTKCIDSWYIVKATFRRVV